MRGGEWSIFQSRYEPIHPRLGEFFAHLNRQAQWVRLCLRARLRPGPCQTVLDGPPAAQRLADRAYRARWLCAALERLALGCRRCLCRAFRLDRLSVSDLLLLDRGYPARWLVAALNQRGIPFCMRVEKSGNSGFACVRDFLRSGLSEQVVTLRAVDRRDAIDFECPSAPQTVRLVRHIAPNGQVPFISRTETHCPR